MSPGPEATRASDPRGVGDQLLEREGERQALSDVLSAACAGEGRLVIVRGGAGTGRTTLLEDAHESARTRGIRVLRARGAAFPRLSAFGVVRELLEPTVGSASTKGRAGLFAGSAGLARPLFSARGQTAPADPDESELELVEGISWLFTNLAAGAAAGMLVTVDDAQWCDRPSLRALARTALRLHELGVVIVLALRPGDFEDEDEIINCLSADPRAVTLELAPLSQESIHRLAWRSLDRPVQAEFVAACWEVTGGNPFLVQELLAVLQTEGMQPSADAAGLVLEVLPDAVARSVLGRVVRLGEDAHALANALAVLGPGAGIHHAAILAGLAPAAAARAADALARAELFAAGDPLSFRYPLVASAVARALGPVVKACAHGRAARLLASEGREVERVAAHLLRSPPAADPWAVSVLRKAATEAMTTGAPRDAVQLLRRALDEPPPAELRGEVLLDLACAEARADDPIAIDRLRSALDLADDPQERVRALRELGRQQFLGEHHHEAAETIHRALAELDENHPLASELLVEYLASAGLVEATRPEVEVRFAKVIAEADGGAPPTDRGLIVQVAHALAVRRAPAARVRELIDAALAGGPLDDLPPYGLAASWAVPALVCADELQLAESLAHQAHAAAKRRGSPLSIGQATFCRALVSYELGLPQRTIAEATVAVEQAQAGFVSTLGGSAALLCNAHIECGEVAAARRAIELAQRTGDVSVADGMVLYARSRLALALEQHGRAWSDALAAQEVLARYRLQDHPLAPWRLPAALAAYALGRVVDAKALAEEELALARATGAPRPLGSALRLAGLVTGESQGLEYLAESVQVLQGSQARLAHAHALVDYGATLRRAGQRGAARGPLRQGLQLAQNVGASPLAKRAQEEIRAAGGRRGRAAMERSALTPTERRIADFAGQRLSDREIAARLFISPKTVEWHLGHIYRKLRVHSRRELAAALTSDKDAAG